MLAELRINALLEGNLFTDSCVPAGNKGSPAPYLGYTKCATDIVKPTPRALD